MSRVDAKGVGCRTSASTTTEEADARAVAKSVRGMDQQRMAYADA
jgi:hypothetical protein